MKNTRPEASGAAADQLKFLVASTKKIKNPVYDALSSGWGEIVIDPFFDPKAGYSAVVFDGQQLKPRDMQDPKKTFRQVVEAHVPILLLNPTEKHKNVLRKDVPVVMDDDSYALFFSLQPSRSGKQFNIQELLREAPAPLLPKPQSMPCRQCTGPKPKNAKALKSGPSPRTKTALSQDAVIDYGQGLLGALMPQAAVPLSPALPAAQTPPVGLKYFRVTYSQSWQMSPNNAAGTFSINNTFWGFLNEGPQERFQILVVETTHSGNPGSLNRNDDEDRGWLTAYYRHQHSPAGSFSHMKNIPATSGNPVQQTLSLDIQYKDPISGWSIWNFSTSINDAIPSWKVVNETAGTNVKNVWAVSDPIDGLRFNETAKDGFTFWGWVKAFPDMSTSSYNVHSAGAWRANQIIDWANFSSSIELQFGRLRCKDKTPGVCWMDEWSWWPGWSRAAGWYLDFRSIKPS